MKGQSIFSAALFALSLIGCGQPETAGSEALDPQQAVRAELSGDTTPPVSSTEVQPSPGPNNEYYGNVSITITATDSGGVANITWTMSGAQNGSGTVAGSTANVPVITAMGVTTVSFYAKDVAGNQEPAQSLLINRVPPPANCTTISLSDFNLFLTGDYTGGKDIRGKVAVGGNIEMTNFSVGAGLPADDVENVLVAGGELNISNGGIFGNAHYGVSTTANQTTTFYRGALSQAEPVPFAWRAWELSELSMNLAYNSAANGTVTVTNWGGVYLQGNQARLNVFNVDASAFSSAVYFSVSVPAGSTVVVNVWGESVRFANFGHSYSGVDERSILFNFPYTETITAYNYGFWGTVLAPYANVNFSSGSFDGGFYAASFSGNAEGHFKPLRDFQFCDGGVGQ